MTRGAISKLADRLIAKTLIGRTPSESDGRMHALALTPAGAALVPRLAAIADENDARFFAHLAPRERTGIERMLRGIVDREQIKAVPID
jgi:DNA-binding MarR family transcriptional regulator